MAFASYLALCVDRALRDFWDAWKKHPRGTGVDDKRGAERNEFEKHDPMDRHHFDVPLFLGEVSRDAAEAIKVVLAQPDKTNNTNTRKKLLKHALKDMGWTGRRIAQCWKEIKEALS